MNSETVPSTNTTSETSRADDFTYQIFLLVLSVLALAALVVDATMKPEQAVRDLIQYLDFAVCAVFLFDFFRNLKQAKNRWRYMYTWGWLDLISSIPAVDALRFGRLARIARLLKVLRAVKAARIIATGLMHHREKSAFLITIATMFVLIAVGGAAVLVFENGADANIKSAEQALWWAVVTMTTVGYGDAFPVTTEGRAVAIVLMMGGLALFGVLSGLVTAWFLEPGNDQRTDDTAALRTEIAELKTLMQSMQAASKPSS